MEESLKIDKIDNWQGYFTPEAVEALKHQEKFTSGQYNRMIKTTQWGEDVQDTEYERRLTKMITVGCVVKNKHAEIDRAMVEIGGVVSGLVSFGCIYGHLALPSILPLCNIPVLTPDDIKATLDDGKPPERVLVFMMPMCEQRYLEAAAFYSKYVVIEEGALPPALEP